MSKEGTTIEQDFDFHDEDYDPLTLNTILDDPSSNCHYQEFSASGTGSEMSNTKKKPSQKKSQETKSVDPTIADEHHSIFALSQDNETWVDRALDVYILKPILPKIPRKVHPNHISVFNTLICWVSVFLSFGAVSVEDSSPWGALVMRLLCTWLLFVSLIADCLDGLHARRTNQCSKLGEILDHSLDAANTILIASNILILFYNSVPVYYAAYAIPATAFIYNAQLVIYGRENKWIVPPISGTHAQIIVITGQIIITFTFFFFARNSFISVLGCQIFSTGAILTQIKDQIFNFKILHFHYKESHVHVHLKYVAISLAFAALIVCDLITWHGFIYGNILISWRLNGRYLIRIVLSNKKTRKEHVPDGFISPYIAGWIVALAYIGYTGNLVWRVYGELIFCFSLAFLSLYELYAHYDTIKAYDRQTK